jgi:hypothetical protein
MRSAPFTVDRRWAIRMVVRPAISRSSAAWTWASLSVSSALVASSSSRIGASFRKARAMAMRWRWPPDSRAPASPTQGVVALGQGRDEVVRRRLRAAASISSSEASGRA